MADSLLTSLCGICHVQPPKYKCPRCNMQTCSLPCIKKHKSWSSCTGERDPTVYIPAAKLRTDVGIDHDYNFLTKIEHTFERVERIMVHDRGLQREKSLTGGECDTGPARKKSRYGKGASRGRTTFEGDGSRTWHRDMLRKLNTMGVNMRCLSYGMVRAKENTTTYNAPRKRVNWQVEWLTLNSSVAADGMDDGQTRPQLTRRLRSMLDDTTICAGYLDCLNYHRRAHMTKSQREKDRRNDSKEEFVEDGEEKASEYIRHGDTAQEWSKGSCAWTPTPHIGQNAVTGSWYWRSLQLRKTRKERRVEDVRESYEFFLQVPGTPSREPTRLIPIKSTDTLDMAIAGQDIVEFPTVMVVVAGTKIPENYVVIHPKRGASVQRKKKGGRDEKSDSKKRKRSSELVEYGSSEDDNDDGHVMKDGTDGDCVDSSTSSSGSSSDFESDNEE